MPLESSDYISQLNPAWPLGSDGVNTSDDHHRNTKRAVQQSFPNISAEVTATAADLNELTGAATDGSKAGLNPVGTVIQGLWASAPNGYLDCDGAAIPAQYTDLIALVGPTTPDLRGQFLRGWSSNATVDPDGPRDPGDAQDDADQLMTGVMVAVANDRGVFNSASGPFRLRNDNTGFVDQGGSGGQQSGFDFDNSRVIRTASETRPKNVAMRFVIKW